MIQGQIVWFEIPVSDLDRAIQFYTAVLATPIEKIKILETEQGVFNKGENSVRGVLTVKENHQPGSGVVLFFYVLNLSESLEKVEEYGGKILVEKTLLKQKTTSGHLSIASNLIDGKLGYFAEFQDCEGNRICLYSNA
ncbi:MAG: hypothetical protein K0S26_2639 [Bacteroidota bacterium]|jgi:predicted enzyme related to lactoylglutathione lyase|nr:hypothetical protein [Bacteroidota bacterium]